MKHALHGLTAFLLALLLAGNSYAATTTSVELCRREMQGVLAQCKQGLQCSDKCLIMQRALHSCRIARHEESNTLSSVPAGCKTKTPTTK
jgi:hypothetical protein